MITWCSNQISYNPMRSAKGLKHSGFSFYISNVRIPKFQQEELRILIFCCVFPKLSIGRGTIHSIQHLCAIVCIYSFSILFK